MSKEERVLSVIGHWIPGFLFLTLLVGGLVVGPAAMQQHIDQMTESTGGKGVVFALIGLVGIYYILAFNTNDPFWPVRKRLWIEHTFFFAIHERDCKTEPFVWSSAPIPKGTNIDELP